MRKDYPVIIEYRLNRTITVGTTAFTRGYCGVHQHYPSFDIIDMGGRMYDPTIGRFISPDPYIQDWENSQNFNRYSYCLNNPLKYTDPSGEFWLEFGLGITISAIANGLSTKWLFGGNFWKGAAVGAISYPIGYGVSSILSRIPIYGSIPGMLFEGSLKGISSGVIGGISNKILDNGSFWEGFAVNAVIGAIDGGISGWKRGGMNADAINANHFTGRLFKDVETFSAPLKTGVPLQPDPSNHCYGYAMEYADNGHRNRKAVLFIQVMGNADGANIKDVLNSGNFNDIRFTAKRNPRGIEWQNVGAIIKSGNEVLASTKRDITDHWVNVVSVTAGQKWKVIGGNWKYVLINSDIWDPIKGFIKNYGTNLQNVYLLRF